MLNTQTHTDTALVLLMNSPDNVAHVYTSLTLDKHTNAARTGVFLRLLHTQHIPTTDYFFRKEGNYFFNYVVSQRINY